MRQEIHKHYVQADYSGHSAEWTQNEHAAGEGWS